MEHQTYATTPLQKLAGYLPAAWTGRGALIPVLRFSGAIGVVTPLRPGLTLSTSAAAIERAFSMRGAKAVAIQINSPGGSAVQSVLIYKRIRALAEQKNLKVYVFAEDVAASGGYLLSLAGDEIYADASSIVGSIGVITSGFGFDELINRIGIQRRVYTAGDSKTTLDPFLPEKPEDVERIKSLQRDVHAEFIGLVKAAARRTHREGRRQPVHRRVLVWQEGARAWPDRRPRRPLLQDARALWRGGPLQAGGAVDELAPPQAQRITAVRADRFRVQSRRHRRRCHLRGRSACALVAFWVLTVMPQLLILLAMGAGAFLARRWYRDERSRIAADLARARQAMEQRDASEVVPLERDPTTGVYRPKRRLRRAKHKQALT